MLSSEYAVLDVVGCTRQHLVECRRDTNLDLGLGDIERQVAENDLAAGVGASARNDNGRLVAVRGGNDCGVLGTTADSSSLGAGTTATSSTSSTLVGAASTGLLGASRDDLVESCKERNS